MPPRVCRAIDGAYVLRTAHPDIRAACAASSVIAGGNAGGPEQISLRDASALRTSIWSDGIIKACVYQPHASGCIVLRTSHDCASRCFQRCGGEIRCGIEVLPPAVIDHRRRAPDRSERT
jgi:hypothetical protein